MKADSRRLAAAVRIFCLIYAVRLAAIGTPEAHRFVRVRDLRP
jgi:hypothetical protein